MMDGDNVKLIDFQFSHKNMTHDSIEEALGWTEKYSAPEVHSETLRGGVVRFARVIDAACHSA